MLDSANENITQPSGSFIVQTEVRILFHDIQCVAEFVGEFRLRSADRHDLILAGESIDNLKPFFHRTASSAIRVTIPLPISPCVFSGLRTADVYK